MYWLSLYRVCRYNTDPMRVDRGSSCPLGLARICTYIVCVDDDYASVQYQSFYAIVYKGKVFREKRVNKKQQ